jgi:hypothetical protein
MKLEEMTDTLLHTYNDGSLLKKTTIQALLKIPNWKGNRILDEGHAEKLAGSIDRMESLDKGYFVIVIEEPDASGKITEQRYVVDGQHRLSILRKTFMLGDFPATVTEKYVKSESDAIEYFNSINSSKPIHWEEDPMMVVNRFLAALETEFNAGLKKSDLLIRNTRTRQPFLCIDNVREALLPLVDRLKGMKPSEFAANVRAWNTRKLTDLELAVSVKPDNISENCIARKFALADRFSSMPWIVAALRK